VEGHPTALSSGTYKTSSSSASGTEARGAGFAELTDPIRLALIAGGVDIRTVAERHGHARATMRLDRYLHTLPERDRVAADLWGLFWGIVRVGLGDYRESPGGRRVAEPWHCGKITS
jgi:hypothetical protein